MTSNDEISRSTENNGSASKAFAIPELLEAILLHLTTRDLLLSQRVAKNWKSTIEASRLLRQALFLDPIPAQTAWVARLRRDEEVVDEPNTFELGKFTVTQIPASRLPNIQEQGNEDETTHTTLHVHLNTLLHTRGHWKHLTLDDRIERGEGLRLGRTKSKIRGYGAEMFLTQPPCTEVLLWVDWGRPSRICRAEGVRYGDVLERVERAPVLPYLPHLFLLARGCVALTEEEVGVVGGKLGAKAVGRG